jgi:hypothetical protein
VRKFTDLIEVDVAGECTLRAGPFCDRNFIIFEVPVIHDTHL